MRDAARDDHSHQAFEFTCVRCGPVEVIPMTEIRRVRDGGPRRCFRCDGPISVDVIRLPDRG
jgi:hypothetical protein